MNRLFRQLGWLLFQAAIIAICMYALAESAANSGAPFHSGQAFFVGLLFAYVFTVAAKVIAGQYQYWFTARPEA